MSDLKHDKEGEHTSKREWLRGRPYCPAWLLPEVDLFDTQAEAEQSVGRFWNEQLWDRPGLLLLILAIILFVLIPIGMTIETLLAPYLGPRLTPWAGSVTKPLPMLLILPVLFSVFGRKIRRHLRTALIAKGVPICLRCGYDLR
jgi:hypothetical protein